MALSELDGGASVLWEKDMISNLDAHLSEDSFLTDSAWADGDNCSPVDGLLGLEDDSSLRYLLAIWLLHDDSVQKRSQFLECKAHC